MLVYTASRWIYLGYIISDSKNRPTRDGWARRQIGKTHSKAWLRNTRR